MAESLSPSILGSIGTGIQAAGQLNAGSAARRAGESQQAAAEYSAQQLDTNAGQAQAASQRAAAEELRKSMLLQSRAMAVSAASGGGAVDPTVMALISGLSKEGQLASETMLYGGNEKARAMHEQAKATRFEGATRAQAGRTAERTSQFSAMGTILTGATKDWSGNGFKNPRHAPISESETVFTGNP
jgi:hypothetical protein